jgi:hypothetical protein
MVEKPLVLEDRDPKEPQRVPKTFEEIQRKVLPSFKKIDQTTSRGESDGRERSDNCGGC